MARERSLKKSRSKESNRIMPLPEHEVLAILRAADDIIAEGGRTLLSKILKGSKEKKLLELGLDRNPAYGCFKELKPEQIMEKVDRMIDGGFLKTEMSGKLPMIVFTPLGWAIERERRAEEFLREWDDWIENKIVPISMEYLKERNRGMILLFLYKILCRGDKKYIPFLSLWEQVDFKKVRAEIRNVMDALERREHLEESAWEQLKRERAQTLLVRGSDPVLAVCQECDGIYLIDETNPDCYAGGAFRFPDICRYCVEQ
ncbi:RQC-minor-1 family DNA-binding protein [Paenibacillus alkalitolerans]|uniref:RQC-minor-1 family DNA-binding protein n=1 Tax=Paenibacillus alkalitolerans TaxID=2799335 RepID=UPI0018F6240B|nr:RQC-minor-1 family DNA-binding protein [Paenibacillus alkalitolerans]